MQTWSVRTVFFGLLLNLAVPTQAQDFGINPLDPANNDIIREKHHKSFTLPDGIALIESTKMLAAVAEQDFDGVADWLSHESGISARNTPVLLRLLFDKLGTIENETRLAKREMGCTNDGAPRAYGDEVFSILDSMSDIQESIAAEHLDDIKTQLDKEDAARFHEWLRRQKKNISFVKFDYQKAYDRFGLSGDGTLTSLCSAWEKNR